MRGVFPVQGVDEPLDPRPGSAGDPSDGPDPDALGQEAANQGSVGFADRALLGSGHEPPAAGSAAEHRSARGVGPIPDDVSRRAPGAGRDRGRVRGRVAHPVKVKQCHRSSHYRGEAGRVAGRRRPAGLDRQPHEPHRPRPPGGRRVCVLPGRRHAHRRGRPARIRVPGRRPLPPPRRARRSYINPRAVSLFASRDRQGAACVAAPWRSQLAAKRDTAAGFVYEIGRTNIVGVSAVTRTRSTRDTPARGPPPQRSGLAIDRPPPSAPGRPPARPPARWRCCT